MKAVAPPLSAAVSTPHEIRFTVTRLITPDSALLKGTPRPRRVCGARPGAINLRNSRADPIAFSRNGNVNTTHLHND